MCSISAVGFSAANLNLADVFLFVWNFPASVNQLVFLVCSIYKFLMNLLATKLLAMPESASARIVTDRLFLLNKVTIKIGASSFAQILLSLVFPAILALANLVLENVKQGLIASSI